MFKNKVFSWLYQTEEQDFFGAYVSFLNLSSDSRKAADGNWILTEGGYDRSLYGSGSQAVGHNFFEDQTTLSEWSPKMTRKHRYLHYNL